jgi:uncharacterized protein (TIGR02246 family)
MSDGAKYEALVQEFCDAWAEGDHDKVVAFFTEDGVYHNIPVDPMVGHEAIRMLIEGFTAGLKVKVFRIDNMISNGPMVVTERVEAATPLQHPLAVYEQLLAQCRAGAEMAP